ncbi:hypothetical protein KR059_000847 [Drosophila kikkawai]|nr:hypothetical protein KR059_000847 [Drosophila kikkawai]
MNECQDPASPIAIVVKMHPVVRKLNSSIKQKRGLSFSGQKRRRDEQLVKVLGSQASNSKQSPHMMAWMDVRDSVVTRNIEKMVRESQIRLQSRRISDRVEKRGTKELAYEIRKRLKKPAVPAKGKVVKKPLGQEQHRNLDVRISRMPAGSKSTNDPSRGNLQSRPAYHMRIARFQAKNFKDLRKRSKDNKTKPKHSAPATCKLMEEEQKRLDILKAEWVQLKGLETAARHKQNAQLKESKKPMDPEAGSSTDLDLNTLIVDPKSFLTKVHVKSQFFSVDLGDNMSVDPFMLESPDVFPDTT